jgi:serine/threonine protein kinase
MYFRRERTLLNGVSTPHDYFEIDNATYQALPLDFNDPYKGIGINSSVFRARPEDGPEEIVKICNYGEEGTNERLVARRRRFYREIEAMERAVTEGKENLVVRLLGDGFVRMRNDNRTHKCFLMESADRTLDEHLGGKEAFTLQQRLLLCIELLRAVRALHEIGVYHRDIKPENIFLVGDRWKIGDLGLIGFRGQDADLAREKIGPPTWMAPEAFNKAYCLLRDDNTFIDRNLDERSDVYQIGKLSWYILQGDIPNGCLKSRDLVHAGEQIYGSFLKPMLRYRQQERPTLSDVENNLAPLMRLHSLA